MTQAGGTCAVDNVGKGSTSYYDQRHSPAFSHEPAPALLDKVQVPAV